MQFRYNLEMKIFPTLICLLLIATISSGVELEQAKLPVAAEKKASPVIETISPNPIKVQIAVSSETAKPNSQAINGIPDVVLSAIVASIISALSSAGILWLSNKGNRERQIEDHAQEVRENDKERKVELRKEIYLELSDASIKATEYLTNLALNNLDKEIEPQTFNQTIAVLSKVVLVAEMPAQKTANELISVYLDIYMKMLEWRKQFTAINNDIKAEPVQLEHHEKLQKLLGKFIESLIEVIRPMRKLQAKLLVQVRAELGIVTDLEVLERQIEEMTDESFGKLRNFHDKY